MEKGSHSVGCSKVYTIIEIWKFGIWLQIYIVQRPKVQYSWYSSFFNQAKIWLSMLIHIFLQECEIIFVLFSFAELAEQFQVHNLYKTHKSTKNCMSNFGFLKKVWICLVFFLLDSIQEIHINGSQASQHLCHLGLDLSTY